MTGYISTFERRELKYRIARNQLTALQSALFANMEPDAYGKTLISSMYFDTPSRDCIGRSVERPLYKEKIRLRRYGSRIMLDGDPCFVELKKKYAGIVYKRRLEMSGGAAGAFLSGESLDKANLAFPPVPAENQPSISRSKRSRQIAAELAAFCKRSGYLVPSMLIECERTAWVLPKDSPYAASELRITIDEDLRYCDLMSPQPDTQQSNTQQGTPLIAADEAILEIKALNAMPRWLVQVLDAAQIRPASFTKYGSAYKAVTRREGSNKPIPQVSSF